MPWTREEKIFCVTTYLETKLSKTVQAKFCRKFNFNNYPPKSQIYHWVHKLQATGSVNNLNKKARNPRCYRKLTVRCPDNVDVVRDSFRRSSKKLLPKMFPITWSCMCIIAKILKERISAVPIQNPDQA